MRHHLNQFAFLFVFFLMSLSVYAESSPLESGGQKFVIEKLWSGEDVIWGFDFLDSSNLIFTERKGQIKILNLKTKGIEVIENPPQVFAKGQGGLLDIRVSPNQTKEIYFTYSDQVGKELTTALGRGTIEGKKIKNFKRIFLAQAANKNQIHFGSRIEFDGEGHLWITIGDRNERKLAQDKMKHHGKIIRLKLDGSPALENPFSANKNYLPEIWSLGHRSPQGLSYDRSSKQLWMSEMGPRGGDEINLIYPGKNYGWPLATFGKEYWGPSIGEISLGGMEQPVLHWVPSISPSAIMIYQSDAFPKWKGNLFIATLSGQHLRRIEKQGSQFGSQHAMLSDLDLRFRNVRSGPEGYIYFSTDQGNISRLVPKN